MSGNQFDKKYLDNLGKLDNFELAVLFMFCFSAAFIISRLMLNFMPEVATAILVKGKEDDSHNHSRMASVHHHGIVGFLFAKVSEEDSQEDSDDSISVDNGDSPDDTKTAVDVWSEEH